MCVQSQILPSISREDELPMTMQVGMVGSDGIVLASDTKWTENHAASGSSVRQDWSSPKIDLDPTRKVAVACAKDMRKGVQIARAILAELSSDHWENPQPKLEEIAASRSSPHSPFEAECLIGLACPSPRLFHLACGCSGGPALCTQIQDRRAAGDALNSALFWHMRYYKVMPVRKLIRLAAQIIVDAAEISSGGIGGLKIAYTKGPGFRFLPDEETREVEAEARKRGSQIEKLLLAI